MGQQNVDTNMKFATWIDTLFSEVIHESVFTYNARVHSLIGSDQNFYYQGKALLIKECEKHVLNILALREYISFNRKDNCEIKSDERLMAGTLVTNDPDLNCIYNGPVEFCLSSRYKRRLRLRRDVVPVFSKNGWFGILIYTRKFYFQKQWNLIAFSSDPTPVQIVPQVLIGHQALVAAGETPPDIGQLLEIKQLK